MCNMILSFIVIFFSKGVSAEGRISVYLNRCTGFDHQCRVRYMLVLGDGEKRLDSGLLDDVSDSDGKSYGWHSRYKFSELVTKVRVKKILGLFNIFRSIVLYYFLFEHLNKLM